jgi:hypothetical protein
VTTNTPENQTAIKVHYVDLTGSPLAAVGVSYGWPLGTSTPSPDLAVSPLDLNSLGYHLITDRSRLDQAAINLSLNPNTVLDTTGTFPYPTTGTLNLYYIYAADQPCPWDSNLDIDDPGCVEPVVPCPSDPSLSAADENCREPDTTNPDTGVDPDSPAPGGDSAGPGNAVKPPNTGLAALAKSWPLVAALGGIVAVFCLAGLTRRRHS